MVGTDFIREQGTMRRNSTQRVVQPDLSARLTLLQLSSRSFFHPLNLSSTEEGPDSRDRLTYQILISLAFTQREMEYDPITINKQKGK